MHIKCRQWARTRPAESRPLGATYPSNGAQRYSYATSAHSGSGTHMIDGHTQPGLSAVGASRQPVHILLVEDHDDTREVITTLLRKRGYIVSTARDCAEA